MDVDTVRILKTQDLGYVRTTKSVVAREVKNLEERVALAAAMNADNNSDEDDDDDFEDRNSRKANKPKKIVFSEDLDQRQSTMDAQREEEGLDDDEAKRKSEHVAKLRRRLQHAKKKMKTLTDAELELEVQQAKMAKTATSGGITKSGKRRMVFERKR
jgi:U3 small nucleolar RNA-associated protein 11